MKNELNITEETHNKIKGTYNGYSFEISQEPSMAGYELTYYHVIAPYGEFIIDSFTEETPADIKQYCIGSIEYHIKYGEI